MMAAAGALLRHHSIELSARHRDAVPALSDFFEPGTEVFVTWLPGQPVGDSIDLAAALAAAGYVPVPHLAARWLASREELGRFLAAAAGDAGVDRVLAVAGDLERPRGPFASVADLLDSGLVARAGIRTLAFAGHPEGHPAVSETALEQALVDKVARAEAQGIAPRIVTQFCFEAAPVGRYLARLAALGVKAPVRVGLAGPAGLDTLTRFALRCGIGNSIRALRRRPSLLGRLARYAGPDQLLVALDDAVTRRPGVPAVEGLHIFPFGGVARAGAWSRSVRASHAGGAVLPG